MQKNQTKKLVLTSLFIAIGLVLSMMRQMVFFGGGAGMRLSISGYVTALPSFLFGPLWGGLSMGISDVLSHFIKPEGAYILPLTLSAIFGGVLRGILWKCLKNKKISYSFFFAVFFVIFAFGAVNMMFSKDDNVYAQFLSTFEKKQMFLTYVPMMIGMFSEILLIINKFLEKTKYYSESFLGVLCVLMTSNIIVTTVNTFILMAFVPSLSKLAFSYFYIPRLAEELANTSVQSYVTAYLLKVSRKFNL